MDTLVGDSPQPQIHRCRPASAGRRGALGVGFAFGGLAYGPGGDVLYMVDGGDTNALYSVDRGTGAATRIRQHGINDMFARRAT